LPERGHRKRSARKSVERKTSEAAAPAAPTRAFWSGTLTFGLVNIPVELLSGVRARQTSMKMVDAKGRPLGRQYYCPEDDKKLSNDDIVRGYETDDGKMIVVTDAELDAIAPEMTRDIELRRFVPLEQIPATYYLRPYFLAPSGRSTKAYHLLAETMQRTGRVGIGTFVMRGHQYLVAILSDGGLLRAETLRFADELRTPEDVALPKRRKVPARRVSELVKGIGDLSRDELDMDELSDRYAEAIHELVEAKEKKGRDVIEMGASEDEDTEEGAAEVIDLMRILKKRLSPQATLETANDAGGTGGASDDDLDELSKQALYDRAQALDIEGRSRMGKQELIKAIRAAA
jgi:DNA end-binding protein Ku